jgi:hypothetical protein
MVILMVMPGNRDAIGAQLDEIRETSRQGGGVIYRGRRLEGGAAAVKKVRVPGGYPEGFVSEFRIEDLDPAPSAAEYKKYYGFEAGGFSWGNHEGGTLHLAMALILDATLGNTIMAVRYHPDFADRYVAQWGDAWHISAAHIRQLVEQKEDYLKQRGK